MRAAILPVLTAIALIVPTSHRPSAQPAPAKLNTILYGAAYYPEYMPYERLCSGLDQRLIMAVPLSWRGGADGESAERPFMRPIVLPQSEMLQRLSGPCIQTTFFGSWRLEVGKLTMISQAQKLEAGSFLMHSAAPPSDGV
jgi:hypothetical protein